jgi:UDP-N-acetylmuramate--alanine ligase
MNEFAGSFHQADSVWIVDIYAASEKPIEGITSEELVRRVRSFGHKSVEYVPGLAEAAEGVARAAQPGDLVLTLGAGNVWQAGDLVLNRLGENS